MDVALLFRRPGAFFSIEEVFETVAAHMPETIGVNRKVAPCGGAGTATLLANCRWAYANRSSVNHITGDIHYVAMALPSKKTILSVHDLRILEGPASLRKIFLKLLWFTLPVRSAGYVTVISEATRRELLNTVRTPPAKVRVIPDPVAPRFAHTPRPFNRRCPTLLQVGTTDNKNISRLAEAVQGIPCRLVILGKPTDEQINCLRVNKVNFEWVSGLSPEEVVDLYRSCDIVTFVSTCEGFGLPIVEGNAVGRPVITSRVSSMPEVAGDAALQVDPYSVTEIRDAIQAVISNSELREGLVRKGLKNVVRFSAPVIAGRYAELYQEVDRGAR